ncbi:hypothetical protein BC834DRAFT_891884 [Gloeopeniophorella convolvens]|nr:hypothetical protein BC834DRAFT_891884 [Gloeopeniophorella convolvens]
MPTALPGASLLLSLPEELLVCIFLLADHRTMVTCRQVCLRLKIMIDCSAALQYEIELAAAGMQDWKTRVDVSNQRLRLAKYVEAWRKMTWSACQTLPVDEDLSLRMISISGNVAAFQNLLSTGDITLRFKRFPSEIRGVELAEWNIIFPSSFIPNCLDIDEAQDLCIFGM